MSRAFSLQTRGAPGSFAWPWLTENAQFCGLDSESIGDAEVDAQNALVRSHMQGISRMFAGKRVRFISLIEGNMSWVVANQIGRVMEAFQPMYHGCKSEKEKIIGLHTSEEVKINMVNTARTMMHQKRIKILKDPVCEGRRKGLQGADKSASILRLFGEQLKRLQQKIKTPKDIFGRSKSKITGKVGNYQDDLAIASLLAVHWATAHHVSKALPYFAS